MPQKNFTKTALDLLKYSGISVTLLLALLLLLPLIFPGFISQKIKAFANENVNANIQFTSSTLSFFQHFPSLTLTLNNVTVTGREYFTTDTLIAAKELSFGINLKELLYKRININELYLNKGKVNIMVTKNGLANYDIYKSGSNDTATVADTASTKLKIEKIQISNSQLRYYDASINMLLTAANLSYVGKGDLSKAIFDLASKADIEQFSFYYDGIGYVENKAIKGELITKINTNSLALVFEKNNILVNKLPLQFNGSFEFLKNGYSMDFKVKCLETDLNDVYTALPKEYLSWKEQTKLSGYINAFVTLKGNYIAESSTYPTLEISSKIRDGSVQNVQAPLPVTNLFINTYVKLPNLNTDSLQLKIDTCFFNMGKDYADAKLTMQGLTTPTIDAAIKGNIDLGALDAAVSIPFVDVKGKLVFNAIAKGTYATKTLKNKRGGIDTVLWSIPTFTLNSSIENGYFKQHALPIAIENISANIVANCSTNQYQDASINITNIYAKALSNVLKGSFSINNLKDYFIDANLVGALHLADIAKIVPLTNLQLQGDVALNFVAKGNYDARKKIFPKTATTLQLSNGAILTQYYPKPIEKIKVEVDIENKLGTFTDLSVNIKPISFEFEGKPFFLKAGLQNLNNLRYNIVSKGIIDIGKIYEVFAINGYGVKGQITTDIQLNGKQSDAANGRYARLDNKGVLTVKNIVLTADAFPKPLLINNGVFTFKQDNMLFKQFTGTYGASTFQLNGSMGNVLNYLLKNEALKGNFSLKAPYLLVDEFMSQTTVTTTADTINNSIETGVILLPNNIDMAFNAAIKKVVFNGIKLADTKGELRVKDGALTLDNTSFTLAKGVTNMQANYTPISPKKANFSYTITANNFDIKEAYKEIALLRTMAPSAASASGIVSLNYNLSGRLNSQMMPVLPSVKGGGTLTLEDVKFKKFKLLAAMGKATGRDSLSSGKATAKKIKVTSSIANNILTIQRTKLRLFGFRPRFEGQMSLTGKLNLKARLGLPPLGIFGIPMSITGTSDKPIIKMKRGKESDTLTEEKDTETED